MGLPTTVVLASNNAKKLAELQALLAPLGVSLVTQGSLGIAEAHRLDHVAALTAAPCGGAERPAGAG